MTDETKTSGDLEREVEESRERVNATLNQLRDRMSPGQIVDEMMGYARSNGGGDFVRNLTAQARDNPLPILLIGAGIAWLMSGRAPARIPLGGSSGTAGVDYGSRRPYDPLGSGSDWGSGADGSRGSSSGAEGPGLFERATDTMNRTTHDIRDAVSGAASAVSGAASAVGGAAQSAIEGVRGLGSRGSAAASHAGSALHDAAGSAGGAFSSAAGSVGGSLHHAAGAVGSAGSRLHQAAGTVGAYGRQGYTGAVDGGARLARLAEDNPVALGAIGIAIGAALGVALPGTRMEDSLMGERADQLKGTIRTAAGDAAEKGTNVAKAAMEGAKEKATAEASEAGLI